MLSVAAARALPGSRSPRAKIVIEEQSKNSSLFPCQSIGIYIMESLLHQLSLTSMWQSLHKNRNCSILPDSHQQSDRGRSLGYRPQSCPGCPYSYCPAVCYRKLDPGVQAPYKVNLRLNLCLAYTSIEFS